MTLGWTAAHVIEATGGWWATVPDDGWCAAGLCVWRPSMQPGDMVVLRGEADLRGVPARDAGRLQADPSAFVVSDPGVAPHDGVPVLVVDDVAKAVLDLGRYARQHFSGKVIAVTGSAGKTTTVAMVADLCRTHGSTAATRHNANLPYGVAWNLASIPWDTRSVVLELAVGRMRQNSEMAQPDVAVVTNILPAHLEFHSDLTTIAKRKSRIFDGMIAGGWAVLNREMSELATFTAAARGRNLNVFFYGESEDCDLRLTGYDPVSGTIEALLHGVPLTYTLQASGRHMVYNSLAALGAISVLGYGVDRACRALAEFQPLSGRGAVLDLSFDDKKMSVVDDAYNANPGSMEAAVASLGATFPQRRKLLVLGEMLELGPDAQKYHSELAATVQEKSVDRVYAVGSQYREFWNKLPTSRRGVYADNLSSLRSALRNDIVDGDVILVKGSHGTRIHTVVDWLKAGAPALNPHVGALVYDCGTHTTTFSQNVQSRFPPASLTKLLTLSLIEDRLATCASGLDEELIMSDTAVSVNSCWGFEAGDRVSIGELMTAAMVVSANEAATMLAEWHSGSAEGFTEELNQRARDLGMSNTRFASPSGLGGSQWTTAADALTMALHVRKQYPRLVDLAVCPEFRRSGKVQRNTNSLLSSMPGVDGLKTGRLGSCFNLILSSSLGAQRIVVLLGAESKHERDDGATWLYNMRED